MKRFKALLALLFALVIKRFKILFVLLIALVLAVGVFSFINTPIRGRIVKAGEVIEGPAFIRPNINEDKVIVVGAGDEYLVGAKEVIFYSTYLTNNEIQQKMKNDGWELKLY
jgi:hypothetical protein